MRCRGSFPGASSSEWPSPAALACISRDCSFVTSRPRRLDARSGQTVLELIRRVAVLPDRAVIVVTHDSRVFSYGDRIIAMADGRVERVTAQTAGTPAPGDSHASQ